MTPSTTTTDADVIVVGAGMAGLYLIKRLREAGKTVIVLESGGDVGGTWYWNRYPGARCDVPTTDYSYSFDPELEREWTWTTKYATQPEILGYLNHVADRYELRSDIRFDTSADKAVWDDESGTWTVTTTGPDGTRELTSRFYVMATGCLSMPKQPELSNAGSFKGDVYFTSRWPHEGVDFTGKRVAVIGTGSSGIQAIPIIAEQAKQLVVFQRTPNYSMPAHHSDTWELAAEALAEDRDQYRHDARYSQSGMVVEPSQDSALALDPDERRRRFEDVWSKGHLVYHSSHFADLLSNQAANDLFAEFVREKVRDIVDDPETAEILSPRDYPFGTKRPCLDNGYYETFNRDSVSVVNLRTEPIDTVTATGITTSDNEFEFDAIVYATGFDAMTGAIVAVDITGRDETIADKWAHGPETYLGLMSNGFPNLFMVTGPQSPSVLSNMAVSIEQHVEFVTDTIDYLHDHGFTTIEPTATAEAGWLRHCNDAASITLMDKADSWYVGANVPGKQRTVYPYVGGVGRYRRFCEDAVERGYLGFRLAGPEGEQINDGEIARLQLDVQALLEFMGELDLPALETMDAAGAREFNEATSATRPPGPEVGEIVDGTFPGPDGDLQYRLYRPDTPGPHPIVVYYHGGGWVLGDHASDDPMCRDLCVQSDSVFVSIGYRHAPEHPFPAPVDDAWAGLQWVAEHAAELGGDPKRLAIAGWSAGGNLAAVMTQMARDAGGPPIVAQALVSPVTAGTMDSGSYVENAEGYVLTKGLMEWFYDYYVDESDRADVRVAPMNGELHDLPPAAVMTFEFDPLRDEGNAYAAGLESAGNKATLIEGQGQIHTSLASVDVILSAAPLRAELAAFLRDHLH